MKKILWGLIAVSLMACATPKTWVATGGSRADGTVRLSYAYQMFEKPVLDNEQGLTIARQRCVAWGYADAEAFGGHISACNNYTTSGCNAWVVTAEYQCINP